MIRPAAVVLGALLATCLLLASASAQTDASLNVGWGGFGNTPNENRHSPLTIIDKGNVDQLGRLYTVNFQKIDPSVRRGQQSYPVEQGGVLYLTTNDDNVWALDALSGLTGTPIWRPSHPLISHLMSRAEKPRG